MRRMVTGLRIRRARRGALATARVAQAARAHRAYARAPAIGAREHGASKRRHAQIRSPPMANKPNVENRWWVETTFKKPKQAKSEIEMPELPVAMAFYQVARDYDQDRAKDDLTDNNLRIARQANPAQGEWVYVAMTEEHYPPIWSSASRTSSVSRARRAE